jgi:hypothetical protein
VAVASFACAPCACLDTPPTQGPLQPLAEAIKSTMQAAGAALERLGERTLGEHILAVVDRRKDAG